MVETQKYYQITVDKLSYKFCITHRQYLEATIKDLLKIINKKFILELEDIGYHKKPISKEEYESLVCDKYELDMNVKLV